MACLPQHLVSFAATKTPNAWKYQKNNKITLINLNSAMTNTIEKSQKEKIDEERKILSRLEDLIEKSYLLRDGKCHKLQTGNRRTKPKAAHPEQKKAVASAEPFTSQTFEQWVESQEPEARTEIIRLLAPDESDVIRGTNKNKPAKFRNPYYIYGFGCIPRAFGLIFWVYLITQVVTACYLGNEMGGAFGYPREFWIIVTLFTKTATDMSIAAHFLGKHQDKLIAPAVISAGVFTFLAVSVYSAGKIIPLFTP